MSELKRTPLFDLYENYGAKITPFAGYEMPIQFPLGVMKEHQFTRESAGLFDVSHMGQVSIRAKSGVAADAAKALESIFPIDVLGLEVGEQRYALLLNENGGIEDDVMVTCRADDYLVVVNASVADADVAKIRAAIGDDCDVNWQAARAMIALQGPKAETALSRLADVTGLRFMQGGWFTVEGHEFWISRSGYTGEDGFEIAGEAEGIVAITKALLGMDEVEFIGLGARDSLRLEAGLCLSGQDFNAEITPIEASLLWSISKVRRPDGARSGGYPGAEVIAEQIANGVAKKRVGIAPSGRAPMRGGVVLSSSEGGEAIGDITSGGFGPSLGAPVAMGYVKTEFSKIGTEIFGDVRGKFHSCDIAKLPFVPANFKR